MIEFENEYSRQAKIKVVGVGGGGGNAINRMINSQMAGVEFIAVNTDVQVLGKNLAPTKIEIGTRITGGLGAGAVPEIGKKAAEEDKDKLADVLVGADMIFITAGMGGGTGTGASPILAEVAKATKALTVAVVTKPFIFEGYTKQKIAEEGIKALKDEVDTLITIPNEKLLTIFKDSLPVYEAFIKADEILKNAVSGISDLITQPGLINVDFADVRTVMSNGGRALMGIGIGVGEKKAIQAVDQAVSSPLLEDISIDGAKHILVNLVGGTDLSIQEVNEAVSIIQKRAHKEVHIIHGLRIDEAMYNEVKVTIIATGFEETSKGISLPTNNIDTKNIVGVPVSNDDLETPAYIRRRTNMQEIE